MEEAMPLLPHAPRHRPSMRRRRKTELHRQARAPILVPQALAGGCRTRAVPILRQALTADIPARERTVVTPLRARTAAMPQQVRTVETRQVRTAAMPQQARTEETPLAQTGAGPLARAGVPLEQTPVEVPAREERERQPLAG